MKYLYLILFSIVSLGINAQEEVNIFVGQGYSYQSYYSFETNEQELVDHDKWDLAFMTDGSAGIHMNEGSTRTQDLPIVIALFEAPTNIFADVISLPITTDSLFNIENTWSDGVLNVQKDIDNPLDYGWGLKDESSGHIIGNKVYCIQLRNFSWLKFQILSLIENVYLIKYANLDGTNEKTFTINTEDYPNDFLVKFSFTTEAIFTQPSWDLAFMRYDDPQNAGVEVVQQTVTGVLSAPNIEVAQVDGIDIPTVDYHDYLNEFSNDMTTIGWDWKFFNFSTFEYFLLENRVYFIKLANDDIWKINFIGFGGSTGGNIDFNRTYMGNLSSTTEISGNIEAFNIFPNPGQSENLYVAYDINNTSDIRITIYNILGNQILEENYTKELGFQSKRISTAKFEAGEYIIQIESKDQLISKKYIKL